MKMLNFKDMCLYSTILLSMSLLLTCGRPFPLLEADETLNALAYAMGDYCHNPEKKGTDISESMNGWKTLLDDIYKGTLEPDSKSGRYKLLYTDGLGLNPYPTDTKVSGATVALPLEASIEQITETLLWPNWLEVFTDPQRYYVYNRTYIEGSRDNFLAGTEHYLETSNYQEDVGQQGISFAYTTTMTFERLLPKDDESYPEKGILIVCNMMEGDAERVAGGLDAWMTDLYSFNVYYPVSDTVTYRINGTWLAAGGGFLVFSSTANSGNVGEGINDEIDSLMNWIDSHY